MSIDSVKLNKLIGQYAPALREALTKKAAETKGAKATQSAQASSSIRASEVKYTERSVIAAAKTLFLTAFEELKGEALNEFEVVSAKFLATEVARKVLEEKEA
jgi:hypothetical protein